MTKENTCSIRFPIWEPRLKTKALFSNIDDRKRYKAIRNSSSAFIKRNDVREFIFSRDGYRCRLCGATDDLQVDHINSVYSVVHGKYPIDMLNKSDNLQTLCCRCNASKNP